MVIDEAFGHRWVGVGAFEDRMARDEGKYHQD